MTRPGSAPADAPSQPDGCEEGAPASLQPDRCEEGALASPQLYRCEEGAPASPQPDGCEEGALASPQPDRCEEGAPASPDAVLGLLSSSEMQTRRRKPLRKWATLAGGRQDKPEGSEQYSPESLQRRYQLRQHPDVVRALQDWWSAALSSVQGGGGGGGGEAEHLSRDDYVRLCMLVYQAVLEDNDEEEARASAEGDWEHDTRGAAELGREPFMDALFELADLWTEHSVEAAVYVGFLTTLLHRLAVAGGEYADPAGALGWRAAEEVSYGGYVLEREQLGEEGEEGEEGEGAHESIGTTSPAGTRVMRLMPSPPMEVFSVCLPGFGAAASPSPDLLRPERCAVRAADVKGFSPEGPLSPEGEVSGEGRISPALEMSPWRALKARLNGSENRQVAFHSSAPRAVVRRGPPELSGSPLRATGLAASASEPQLQRRTRTHAPEAALPPLCTRGRRSRAMPPSGEISPETSPPPQNAERTSPQRRAAEVPRSEREAAARGARTLPSLARPGGGSIRASEREREGERLAADGRADGRALAANVYEYEEAPTVRRRTEAAAAAAERRAAHSRLTGFCAVSSALTLPLAQPPAYGRAAYRGADSEKRRRREVLRREAEGAMSLTSTVAAAPVPGGAWFRPEFARLMMMQTQAHQRLVF